MFSNNRGSNLLQHSGAPLVGLMGAAACLALSGASVAGIVVGASLALAGAVIGTGAAMAVTRLMSAMLYNVRPYDPATFAGGCMLLVLVALGACSIPARRAMCIDPMVALRDE